MEDIAPQAVENSQMNRDYALMNAERMDCRASLSALRSHRIGHRLRRCLWRPERAASPRRWIIERFRCCGIETRSQARYSMRDLQQLGVEVAASWRGWAVASGLACLRR